MMNQRSTNKKMAIFAGAGASAALGFPTTPQFVNLLKNRWPRMSTLLSVYRNSVSRREGINANNVPVDSEYLRDWLAQYQYVAEDIATILETQPFDPPVKATDNAVTLIKQILTSFDSLVREVYGEIDPERAYGHYSPFLKALLQRGINLLPIFTTNYDLVFECMRDHKKVDWYIENGMRSTGRRVILNTNVFSRIPPQRPKILLYKLHGSTDWWIKQESDQVERITIGYTPPQDYKDLLIYPTREKYSEVNQMPFSFFYNKFNNYLSSKNTNLCIAIGYSFRDKFINETFVKAISRGMRLLILDVSMKKEQLHSEFGKYVINESIIDDRVRIENFNFGDWRAPSINKLEGVLNEEIGDSKPEVEERDS